MARGWESKAVEDQMEEARQKKPNEKRPALSPAAIELRQRRESLRLSRRHLRDQLARARSDNHRLMLNHSLEEIDRQLAELNRPLSTDL